VNKRSGRIVEAERDPLFTYPLPVPSDTAYRELGLGPDASDEEVQAAKSLAVGRLDAELRALGRSLQETYDAVPGLREAYEEPPDAAGSSDARAKLEALALEQDPGFREKRRRTTEIAARIRSSRAPPACTSCGRTSPGS
jgi:hypothetical protein